MSAQDTGPLDWRIAITDKAGRPTPEFQRRWAIQRNNNALIGSITSGSGAPTDVPDDGALYVDISVTPYVLYLGESGTWHQVSAKFFLDLADAPHSYSGQGLKLVRVNSGATALEFTSPIVGANPSAIASDTAVNGTATTFMRSDAAPAVQKASSTQFGVVEVDGTTITSVGGVISSSGGGGGGGMTLIAQYTTVLGDTTHTFSSIPGTFSDLDLVVMGRGTSAVTAQPFHILVNGLTSGIYSEQRMFSNAGGTIASDELLASTSFDQHVALAGANTPADTAGYMRLRIFNYSNTVFKKLGEWTGRQANGTSTDTAFYLNGNAQFDLTAAITSVTIAIDAGAWVAGSVFSLRGLP